jgi:hypothetical protein
VAHIANNPKRELSVLKTLTFDTQQAHCQILHTVTSEEQPYDKRNVVILSRWPICVSE